MPNESGPQLLSTWGLLMLAMADVSPRSIAEMASFTGRSERRVSAAIKEMVTAGAVTVSRDGRTNRYEVDDTYRCPVARISVEQLLRAWYEAREEDEV